MVAILELVDTLITQSVFAPAIVTKTHHPFGVTAMPLGSDPAGIVVITVFEDKLTTDMPVPLN